MREYEEYKEAFLGAIMGVAVGDALGRPFEGWNHELLIKRFGLIVNMYQGIYSDDTEMTIGIMEAIIEDPSLPPEGIARRFAENYNAWRGYGPRTHLAIRNLKKGLPWDQVGSDSWGNGAAMRVSPIGLFYFDDLEKVKEKATLSAVITHKHPEAIAGSVAQALGVAFLTRKRGEKEGFSPQEMIDLITEMTSPISPAFSREIEKVKEIPFCDTLLEKVAFLAKSFPCDVSAKGSVPVAFASFLMSSSFKEALLISVNVGGDTDTICAMTGALAGAYYGFSSIPSDWLEKLEDGPKGRTYILTLAQKLYEMKFHEKSRFS
jgi:poly(ADP-ribose) glycohydrolase ARH3